MTYPSSFAGIPIIVDPYLIGDQWYIIGKRDGLPERIITSEAAMRKFETGATRDVDTNKPDYEGFYSPAVMEAFGAYMHKNRTQADGNVRDSDNWQKGIPQDAYMKSGWRHFFAWWKAHRNGGVKNLDDMLALLFNVQGYIHEHLKAQQEAADLSMRPCTLFGTAKEPILAGALVGIEQDSGLLVPMRSPNQADKFQAQLDWVASRTPYAEELGLSLSINLDSGVVTITKQTPGMTSHVELLPTWHMDALDSFLSILGGGTA